MHMAEFDAVSAALRAMWWGLGCSAGFEKVGGGLNYRAAGVGTRIARLAHLRRRLFAVP